MSRLAYICSMPHSGSTAFSLFLGTHSKLVGLGGIDRAVAALAEASSADGKGVNLPCTCGQTAANCVYWGGVVAAIRAHRPPGRRERYQIALDTFHAVFGSDAWPVDSSKHVEPLEDICTLDGLELRALHLIKDVRALTSSFIDQARKNKTHRRPGVILSMEYFWRWHRENRKIERLLANRQIQSHRFGYEELCLAPEAVMKEVSRFLDVQEEAGSLCLKESRSHLIVGNRMRNQKEKQQLRYDNRWFSRRDWALASLVFPQIRRYNSTAVYSNQTDAMWTK